MVNEKESSNLLNSLLFPKVFQTFRMAIQPSKLMIAFLAVTVIYLAGCLMDIIFMAGSGSQDEAAVFSILWNSASVGFHGALESLFALNIPGVAQNITSFFTTVGQTFKEHYIYCLIFFAIKLIVISLAGGAICRIAALQFAQGEKPGLTEALRFSTKKFTSFFTAPLAPLGIIIFIGFFIFLLGLVGNIPLGIGKVIMVIFMLLALIASGLITVVLIGAVAGFNLMFPAVAYDDSDCFDAISRSFSYIFAKPWRMAFYTTVAAVYGAICYIFVRFFAFLLLWITRWFLQLGILGDNSKLTAIWQDAPTFTKLVVRPNWAALTGLESFAAFLVYLLLLAVVVLVVAFLVSFYFSANTIIYSLMRKAVDGTGLEDVYVNHTSPGSATGNGASEQGSHRDSLRRVEPTTTELEEKQSEPESTRLPRESGGQESEDQSSKGGSEPEA